MELSRVEEKHRPAIKAYGDGHFHFPERIVQGHVLVFPDLVTPWPVTVDVPPVLADFAPVLDRADSVDICLFGGGMQAQWPDREIREAFKAAGIALEIMGTGPACRTFNILLSEDRSVAAALIAV